MITDRPDENLRLLEERLATISDVNSAASVLAWDSHTYMPEVGAAAPTPPSTSATSRRSSAGSTPSGKSMGVGLLPGLRRFPVHAPLDEEVHGVEDEPDTQ